MNGQFCCEGFIFLLAFVAVNGQQGAAVNEPSSSRQLDDDLVPLDSQVALTPHIPPAIEAPRRDITEILAIYRIIMWYLGEFQVEEITTTTTLDDSETTVTTTRPYVTTDTTLPAQNPCTKWTPVGTCQYYLFEDRLSWNDANAKCQMSCDSKLAFRQIQDAGGLSAVVNTMGIISNTFWVGLTDSDGPATGAGAKWNDATSATFTAPDYLTLGGVRSCGYYDDGSMSNFYFQDCYQTPTETPAGFLCEFCS